MSEILSLIQFKSTSYVIILQNHMKLKINYEQSRASLRGGINSQNLLVIHVVGLMILVM